MASDVDSQPPGALAATFQDEPWYEHAKTLQHSPSATLIPSTHTPDSLGRQALEALSKVAEKGLGRISREIELGGTLGEGGMGVVRLGTQVTMGRPVAVKTLKDGVTGDRASLKFLREAWITGAVEHPNVVPVYDVGVDAQGRPLIVLKKIEGTEWTELMQDAVAVATRFGVHDLLTWNLGVLKAVCNAVRFAHSRGVLHRDLKPENVMIGPFGEVYVVDWGIAVSMHDDGSGRLPLAVEATEMAGTPYYMAPEMLGGGGQLTERSDVYLLGSLLYEIVAGHAPHQGENLMAVVTAAALSRPAIPEGTPGELRDIIQRAMARQPERRYASVDEFRLALISFEEHRHSMALAEEAGERLDLLTQLLGDAKKNDAADRERIYNVFSECRFAFRAALAAWGDNAVARSGVTQATEAMASYELEEDDPRAAQALVAQLDDVDSGLQSQIDALSEDKSKRQEELSSLADRGRDEDQDVGRRTRSFLAVVLGIMWTALPLISSASSIEAQNSWFTTFTTTIGILGVAVAFGIWARESMTKTAFNRRVTAAVLTMLSLDVLAHAGNYLSGVDPVSSQVISIAIWATVAAFSTVAIDRRLWPTAVAAAIAFLLSSAYPEYRWYAMSACSASLLLNAALIWRLRKEDVQDFERRMSERFGRFTSKPPPPE